MLDLSYFQNNNSNVQIFQANGTNWQTWVKPRNCNYVWIMCIGGAGGGAGGATVSSVNYSLGGTSAAITRGLFNAQQVPDILYVQVGLGGAGGASATNGSAGTRSWVAIQQSNALVIQNLFFGSGTAAANGGVVSATASISGETTLGPTLVYFLNISNYSTVAGVSSIFGTGQPANITPLTGTITCPGGHGPGRSAVLNGSSILETIVVSNPLIAGGIGVSVGNGGNGSDGITSFSPFYSLGGSGGGCSTVGIGGNGGNGGIGSGGGAGGAGLLGGGTGGKGGDGIVMIMTF